MCAQMQQLVSERTDMVRDMDVVRDILRRIEGDPWFDNTRSITFPFKDLGIDDVRYDEVKYDVTILLKEGYINGQCSGIDMPMISGLTWKGHELIADISDPGIWEKAKEKIKDMPKIGIALMWEIAKSEIRKKVGLS